MKSPTAFLPAFVGGLFAVRLFERAGTGNGVLFAVGGALIAAAIALAVVFILKGWGDPEPGTPAGLPFAAMIYAGAILVGVALARCITDRARPEAAHRNGACHCGEHGPDGEEQRIPAQAGDADPQKPVVPAGLLGVEGAKAVERRLGGRRADGAAGAIANDAPAKEAPVDHAGDGDDRFAVATGRRGAGTPREMGERGKLDVVHAADSSTGAERRHPAK